MGYCQLHRSGPQRCKTLSFLLKVQLLSDIWKASLRVTRPLIDYSPKQRLSNQTVVLLLTKYLFAQNIS